MSSITLTRQPRTIRQRQRPLTIAERRLLALDLCTAGWSQRAAALAMNVPRRTLRRDLAYANDHLLELVLTTKLF